MSTIIQTRLQSDSFSLWERFCRWVTSTEKVLSADQAPSIG